MHNILCRTILLLVLWPFCSSGQELSYSHFDMKDGLAGSTVYSATQDRDGFLWFGTETGVSRFDGKRFTNFTIREGLPDNEVLKVFADSRGRVWMAPFKKSICYYYRGTIFNQHNDPMLAKINFSGNILQFVEDKHGNVFFHSSQALYMVTPAEEVVTIHSITDSVINGFNTVGISVSGNLLVVELGVVYEYDGKQFQKEGRLPNADAYSNTLSVDVLGSLRIYLNHPRNTFQFGDSSKWQELPTPKGFVRLSALNDTMFYVSSRLGLTLYNRNDIPHPKNYLPGKHVTSLLMDQEGSYWFTTAGNGVYRLNSEYVQNLSLHYTPDSKLAVMTLSRYKDKIIVCTEMGFIFQASIKDEKISISRKGRLPEKYDIKKVASVKVLPNDDLLFATDVSLIITNSGLKEKKAIAYFTPKALADFRGTDILIAAHHSVIVYDPIHFKEKKTVWHERSTTVYHRNDTIFIGAISGLYLVLNDSSIVYWGNTIPALRSRITAICESQDGTLWFATSGEGVLGYRNGSITKQLTVETGLTSNTVRCLYSDSCYLWIGTDKGLNKINIHEGSFPVQKFTTADGLTTDVIHSVLAYKGHVFVGTPDGLTWFDESKISSYSRCDLRITGITVADEAYPADTAHFELPASGNPLRIEFSGISYRSAGDVLYWYRLGGLDSTWRTTRDNFLSYPTLPAGSYNLQLQAVNKFGVASSLVSIPFRIPKLLWQKSWFQLCMSGILLFLLWMWTNYRVRQVKKQEVEKLMINKRINELEQLALRAQMNPHFIFNSLNSIQQYVMDKDIAGANRFISSFSKLIRQTLYFSSRALIPLSEELDYLTTYLALEKDRLEDKFNYIILVPEELKVSDYHIPPMILQPYLENSVRHGVRYRKDELGLITITIRREKDRLVCMIEDNGVGRQTSSQFNSRNPVEYQSKGMSLTADRIAMMNRDNTDKIDVAIDDLVDTAGHGIGTKITVRFPVWVN